MKLRVIGWINSAFSGDYREAIVAAAANLGLDPTDALTRLCTKNPLRPSP